MELYRVKLLNLEFSLFYVQKKQQIMESVIQNNKQTKQTNKQYYEQTRLKKTK